MECRGVDFCMNLALTASFFLDLQLLVLCIRSMSGGEREWIGTEIGTGVGVVVDEIVVSFR